MCFILFVEHATMSTVSEKKMAVACFVSCFVSLLISDVTLIEI